MIAKRIVLLITLTVIGLAPALRADNNCAATTMTGAYGFSGSGLDIVVHKSGTPTASQTVAPVAFVGTVSFAGDGMLSGSFTATGNGHQEVAAPFKGAYVVNADCTGSISMVEDNGAESHFAVTITAGGNEILAIQTDAGAARTFVIRKQ
jgi:hypothetical protein